MSRAHVAFDKGVVPTCLPTYLFCRRWLRSANCQVCASELGSEGTRAALVERSIEKDGKYEAPTLIAKGKALFTAKTCNLCHTVDPAIPATLGLVYKSPQFIGDFWGKEREVHIGYYPELNFNAPIQKVVFNEQYFIESVKLPYEKVVKGVLSPMVFAFPVNDEEILALMAYVKSLSK